MIFSQPVNQCKDASEKCVKMVFIKSHGKQGKRYIEASDNGSSVKVRKLNNIPPFYTAKAQGRDTGLALPISSSIIHQHKGE